MESCTNLLFSILLWGFPRSSVSKESTCNAGDPSSTPGLIGFPGEGNSNPLEYSCPENPMDSRAGWATVHRVTKSQTTDWLTLSLSQRPTFSFIDFLHFSSIGLTKEFIWVFSIRCYRKSQTNFLANLSLAFVLIVIISFIILTLGLIYSSFSSFLK